MKPNFPTLLTLLIIASIFVTMACSSDENENLAIPSEIEEFSTESITETNDTTTETSIPLYESIAFESNFILDSSRLMLNYVLSETEYTDFLEGSGDLKLVTNKVYEYLNDDFDFIIILSVEEQRPPDLYYGISTKVQNNVEGIGERIYNNASNYGSANRLKNIIHMPKTEYVRSGPFLHEIAHQWANNGLIETTVRGHWGFSSVGGQLGGFDTLENLGDKIYKGSLNGEDGFGSFANGGNSIPYGNLELYLMGLLSAEEVEDIQVAINPVVRANVGEFSADEIKTYSIEDLINEHGARTPNSLYSQKEFKGLAVVISTEAISENKTEEVRMDLENFSRQTAADSYWGTNINFWTATKGKASLDFLVSEQNIKNEPTVQ